MKVWKLVIALALLNLSSCALAPTGTKSTSTKTTSKPSTTTTTPTPSPSASKSSQPFSPPTVNDIYIDEEKLPLSDKVHAFYSLAGEAIMISCQAVPTDKQFTCNIEFRSKDKFATFQHLTANVSQYPKTGEWSKEIDLPATDGSKIEITKTGEHITGSMHIDPIAWRYTDAHSAAALDFKFDLDIDKNRPGE